jgi:predicted RNase H-like HicB family nuclease
MDKHYTFTVQIEKEEGGYLVEVPALPGCHTWGKTYDEAVSNAQEAIQGYLETLKKLGKPIPVEAKHRELHLNVNVPVTA